MIYYHIPTQQEVDDKSDLAKKLTRCGTPAIIIAESPDFVPVVHELLHDMQKHGEPVLLHDKYFYPAIQKPLQDIYSESKNRLTEIVQGHLDKTASSRGYDGILSLCTYATSTDPAFASEGQAGVVFRDACWRKSYEVMGKVLTGEIPVPTETEFIAMMPLFEMFAAASDGISPEEDAAYSGQTLWEKVKAWFA